MDWVAVLGTLAGVAAVGFATWVFRRRAERVLPTYEAIAAQLDLFNNAAQQLSGQPLIATELDALGLAVLGDELSRRFDMLPDDVDLDGDDRAFTGSLRRVRRLRDAQLALIRARNVPALPAPADLEVALRQWDDEHRADALHQHLRSLARSSAAQAAAAVETADAIRVLRQHTDHQINQARELLDGRNPA